MSDNNFKAVQYRYFFYGMCTEDQITQFIEAAEVKGCEFVTLVPGMVPAPQSALTLHAPKGPQYIPVLRVFVRCLQSRWPDIEKAMQEEAENQNKTGGVK